MIDMHTHLDLYRQPYEVAEQTNNRNLFTLAVTTSPRAWMATQKIFSRFSKIKVALGLHPEIVLDKMQECDLLLNSIKNSIFIGEIGLDGSHRFAHSYETQKKIFELTISECEKVGNRIISIHSRNAARDVISILKKYPNHGTVILHWFSDSIDILNDAINMGCFFSFGPVALLGQNGKKIISRVPLNRIFPESDGPFCAINSTPILPWESCGIANFLSKVHGIDRLEIISIFKDNLSRLENRTRNIE